MLYFFVYILKCSDGSYYVGHTDNLEKRISEHNEKRYCCYTAMRLPTTLVFSQEFNTRDEAFAAERKLKGWSRKKKEALIEKSWGDLSKFSKKIFK